MGKRFSDGLVKVMSLGVGMAMAIILIAKVSFELSYDSFLPDVDDIYLIKTYVDRNGGEQINDYGQVSGGVAPGFKESVPGVIEATRITTALSDVFYDEDRNRLSASNIVADSLFFNIFDRPFLAGDPVAALKSWNADIAVSRSFAEKLGGVDEAIGKIVYNEANPSLKLCVRGVFEDFPVNSSLRYDIIASIDVMGRWSTSNWLGNDRYRGYVKLADGVDTESLAEPIRAMQEAHQDLATLEENGMTMRYYLSPYASMHKSGKDVRNLIIILSIIALLLLLVSVMNYVLVAISDVLKRAREVGVRKCYGAGRKNIYGLLFRETAVNLIASIAVAAIVIVALRGPIATLTGVELKDLLIPRTWWLLAGIVLIVFFVSAIIPARMFERIPVSVAFRSYRDSKRKWKLSLLAFQFAVNAFLISLVLIVNAQYRKVMDDDPGYEYENLVYAYIPSLDKDRMAQLANSLSAIPEVQDVELTYCLPMDWSSGNNVYLPGDSRELFNVADQYGATEGFFDMMGFRLLEGRIPTGPNDVAVSRKFVETMGNFTDWSDGAVGKAILITEHSDKATDIFTICGVYEDYVIRSLESADERPSVRFCWNRDFEFSGYDWSQDMQTIVAKLSTVNPETMGKVSTVVNSFLNDTEIEVRSYSSDYQSMYQGTRQMQFTYMIGALFAILIAIIGLIGYVRDENYRRSAEIAIRKVNGARSSEIVLMLVADVMKIAVAAIIIGDIGAWFVAGRWLGSFAYKIAVSPLYFIVADVLVLAVVSATIAVGSLKIARSNPVLSLKQD